jgi:hypothetical protein
MSFSEIVNKIDGDKNEAVKMLINIAHIQQKNLEEIKKLERFLTEANHKYNKSMEDIQHVCKHIGIELPVIIGCKKKLYQISKTFQVDINEIDFEYPSQDIKGIV